MKTSTLKKIDSQLNRVIFLNGPSSSGKTTLAKKLQDKLETPYLHIGIDTIIKMMPEKLNNWTGEKVEQGFWWHISTDKHGNQLTQLKLGPFANKILPLLKNIAITMLQSDHNIIVDEICIVEDGFDEWKKILSPYSTLYITSIRDKKMVY